MVATSLAGVVDGASVVATSLAGVVDGASVVATSLKGVVDGTAEEEAGADEAGAVPTGVEELATDGLGNGGTIDFNGGEEDIVGFPGAVPFGG